MASTPENHLREGTDIVRVSVVVTDSRGFRHFYEELETTPRAVGEAFDLMVRATRG